MNVRRTSRGIGICAMALGALAVALSGPSLGAQTQAAQAKPAERPAAAKPVSVVNQVIEMVKGGLGDDLIVRAIDKEGLRRDLNSSEMLQLKRAGASDKVIHAMMPTPAGASPTGIAPAAPAPAVSDPAPAVAFSASPAPPRDQRRRAAIDAFEWATVESAVQRVFGTNVNVGKGYQALLTKRIQEGGKIRILERAKVETIMKEQDFGASNRVQQGSNARIGRIQGADVYLMGDIVAFGRDDRKKGVALGGFLGLPGPLAGLGLWSKTDKAVVVINYRLVDAETSEVIDTGEARGESQRKGKGIGGLFGWSGGIVGGQVDMTSSNFAQTIIGEAVIASADKLAAVMNAKAEKLPRREIEIEGRVAEVSGSSVTIAAGLDQGVEVGDRFEIFRIVKEIKDPVTGEVLDNQVAKLGELVITSVRDRISIGAYTGAAVTTTDGLARKIMR